jgi:anti-sigma factor RsiW
MRKGRCANSRGGSVTAYLDGALPEASRRGFEEHLERSAACRRELRGVRWLVRQLPLASSGKMPLGLKEALLDAHRRGVSAAR